MQKIINLTQHQATAEQVAAGVVEPADKKKVQALITFDEMPKDGEIESCAYEVAQCALSDPNFQGSVMIGGAPFFMAPLEHALHAYGIRTLYAFSKRESIDQLQADGSVKKTQVFRHAGFIEAKDE